MNSSILIAGMITISAGVGVAQEAVFRSCLNKPDTEVSEGLVFTDIRVFPEERKILSTTIAILSGREAVGETTELEIVNIGDDVVIATRTFRGVHSVMIEMSTGRFWRAGLGELCLNPPECTQTELRNWKNSGTCLGVRP